MAGIKFRRNNKIQLLDAKAGEIVYATDTNEWGLGLSSGIVSWRKHELIFKNLYLQGDGIPEDSLGEVGMYYFDLINVIPYQKKQTGWVEIDFPISKTIIDTNYLASGTVPDYNDFSTIIKKDGSVKAPGHEAVDPQEVLTRGQAVSMVGTLMNDGSTQMVEGYVGTGDKVIVKGQVVFYSPPTSTNSSGVLWNNNGTPEIFRAYSNVINKTLSGEIDTIIKNISHTFARNWSGGSRFLRAYDSDGQISYTWDDPIPVGVNGISLGADFGTAANDNFIFVQETLYADTYRSSSIRKYDAKTFALLDTFIDPDVTIPGTKYAYFGENMCVLSNGNLVSVDPYNEFDNFYTRTTGATGIGYIINPDTGEKIHRFGPSKDIVGEDWLQFGVEKIKTNGDLIVVTTNPDWWSYKGFVDVFNSSGVHQFRIESTCTDWNIPDEHGNIIPNFGDTVEINDHYIFIGDQNASTNDMYNGVIYAYDLQGNFVRQLSENVEWQGELAADGDELLIPHYYEEHITNGVTTNGVVRLYNENLNLVQEFTPNTTYFKFFGLQSAIDSVNKTIAIYCGGSSGSPYALYLYK